MTTSLTQCFKLAPDVMARRVGGEVFILSIQRQCYFGLDEVGARIFALLSDGSSTGAILHQLEEEYSVDPELLRQDFENLIAELSRHELIETVPEHQP